MVPPTTSSKRRAESPPAKAVEPPRKKRRGRPPGLTNRKTGRAQILGTKSNDAKASEGIDNMGEDELELVGNLHQVPAAKALQMNMVLSDINSRISSSSVRAEISTPKIIPQIESPEKSPVKIEKKDESVKKEVVLENKEQATSKDDLASEASDGQAEESNAESKIKIEAKEEADLKAEKDAKIEGNEKNEKMDVDNEKMDVDVKATVEGKTEAAAEFTEVQEKIIKLEPETEVASPKASRPEPSSQETKDEVDAGEGVSVQAEQNGEGNNQGDDSIEASAPSGNSATRCAFPC